jgi:hypothetical protein
LADGKVAITWKAWADIESGIGYFKIYRNNQFIKRILKEGNFQSFSKNGDNPIPATAPLMEFIVEATELAKDDEISISTVNRDGVESTLSKKIKVYFE